MKKILLFTLLAGFLLSCKKEAATPTTDDRLKGKWITNLTTDVVIDNATGAELNRVSYLHGLTTQLTFDGAGSLRSYDGEAGATLVHTYSLRNDNGRTYISTQIVGYDPVEYEILSLTGPDLQITGTVIMDTFYSVNGKNYRAHYIRTQFFTKQ